MTAVVISDLQLIKCTATALVGQPCFFVTALLPTQPNFSSPHLRTHPTPAVAILCTLHTGHDTNTNATIEGVFFSSASNTTLKKNIKQKYQRLT